MQFINFVPATYISYVFLVFLPYIVCIPGRSINHIPGIPHTRAYHTRWLVDRLNTKGRQEEKTRPRIVQNMNPFNRRLTEKKKSKTEVKNYTNQVPGPTNSTQKKK